MEDNTTAAASSMIVDLSGDNDSLGAITAANSIPKPSDDSPFERSCDNPECSAPKLISLVPKRETAEFITEPTIMTQPTLVNGFTTVFQVDGLAAKMNDIMNGNYSDPSTLDGYRCPSKPKTVFRIVPNTHAHIVNYVVVDGAGETLRKIKSNDPSTMQKLLDSQRLSAEQMLRKLISKALMTTRKPDPVVPLPIPSKIPGYAHLNAQNADPISLPTIPPGITITPVAEQTPDPPLIININPKEVPNKASGNQPLKKKIGPTQTAATSKGSTTKPSGPTKTASKDPTPKLAPKTPASKTTSVKTPPVAKVTLPTLPTLATTSGSSTSMSSSTASLTTSTSSLSSPVTTPAPKLPTLANKPRPKSVQKLPTEASRAEGSTPHALKRKQTFNVAPDIVKRLRPRSPNKQKASIAAPIESTPPQPTRKLPTLPKLPTKPPGPSNATVQSTQPAKIAPPAEAVNKPSAEPAPAAKAKESPALRTMAIAKAFATCLAEPEKPSNSGDEVIRVAPSAESSSKVTAMKALAAAQNLNPAVAAKVTAALSAKATTKIGETLITPTSRAKEGKSSTEDTESSDHLSTKIMEFLQKEAAFMKTTLTNASSDTDATTTSKPTATTTPKPTAPTTPKPTATATPTPTATATSKPTATATPKPTATATPKPTAITTDKPTTAATPKATTPTHSTTVLTTISKSTSSSGPKVIAQTKTNLEPMKSSRTNDSTEKDPLALDEVETVNLESPTSKSETPPVTRLTKIQTRSQEATESSEKVASPSTSSDAKAPAKPPIGTPMRTRASNPKPTPTPTTRPGSRSTNFTPTKALRVVLPTLKSGVVTLPIRTPHPNLKIASVISGGSAVAAATGKTSPKPAESEQSSEIEKLQQELADLRRTVQRLSKKKT